MQGTIGGARRHWIFAEYDASISQNLTLLLWEVRNELGSVSVTLQPAVDRVTGQSVVAVICSANLLQAEFALVVRSEAR